MRVWLGVFKVCELQRAGKEMEYVGRRGEAKLGWGFICVYVVVRSSGVGMNSMVLAGMEEFWIGGLLIQRRDESKERGGSLIIGH